MRLNWTAPGATTDGAAVDIDRETLKSRHESLSAEPIGSTPAAIGAFGQDQGAKFECHTDGFTKYVEPPAARLAPGGLGTPARVEGVGGDAGWRLQTGD